MNPTSPAAPTARLHIDWTQCRGRGLCTELLPELLDRDEWGLPLARAGGPTTDVPVPAGLSGHARTAERDCPRLALRLSHAGV